MNSFEVSTGSNKQASSEPRTDLCNELYDRSSRSSYNRNNLITGTPSGKQRQKKSGRGRPTASLIATVRMAVIRTENRRPA